MTILQILILCDLVSHFLHFGDIFAIWYSYDAVSEIGKNNSLESIGHEICHHLVGMAIFQPDVSLIYPVLDKKSSDLDVFCSA